MMKVLHIIPQPVYLNSGSGIRSKNILNYQKGFAKPLAIVSPIFNKSQFPSDNPLIINDIKYYHFLEKRRVIKELYDIRLTRALTTFIHRKEFSEYVYKIARIEKPNLIHAAAPYINGLAGLNVARILKIPFVYEIRTLSDYDVRSGDKFCKTGIRVSYRRKLENIILSSSNALVTLSKRSKEDLKKRGIAEEKIFVVPNGVEKSYIDNYKKISPKQNLGIPGIENKIKIGFIGFLKPIEDVTCLIEAVHILRKQGIKNLIILIVGTGPMLPLLEEYVKSLKLENIIKFLGTINNRDIKNYYRMLDIFVAPRIRNKMSETISPLKIIEAMAMELPVIGSDVGGIKELIEHENNGFLHKAEDPHSLAGEIERLIDNRTLAKEVAKKARKWVLRNKRWEDIIMIYQDIYRRLLDENTFPE